MKNYSVKSLHFSILNTALIFGALLSFSSFSCANSIVVKYKNGDIDSQTHLKPVIELVNNTNHNIDLSTYQLRYWFSNETKPDTPVLDIFYVQNTNTWNSPCSYPYSCIKHTFSSNNNQDYLELDFEYINEPLYPGKKLHLQLGIHSQSWGNFDTSNDFSSGEVTSMTNWENISLYSNNQLVFGVEPDLSPEDAPCLNEPSKYFSASTLPLVIDPNQSSPIKFYAKIFGPKAKVNICLAGGINQICESAVAMVGPDDQCRYTAELSAEQIIRYYDDSRDVNRAVFGFLAADTLSTRRNLITNIKSTQEPSCTIKTINAEAQYCSHLVNLVYPEIFNDLQSLNIDKRKLVTRKFFEFFEDEYDFINIISAAESYTQNRSYAGVSNQVSGVGLNPLDLSEEYGSQGTLKGTVVYPNAASFDGASSNHSHELGHAWANHSKHPRLSATAPHWPISSLAKGIMGYSKTTNPQGLQFNFDLRPVDGLVYAHEETEPKSFSSLTLYAMGLIPPEEVENQIIMLNPDNPNQFPSDQYTTLTINDYIAYNGERIPSHENSQKNFKVATVIVSDKLLDQNAMTLFNAFAKRIESENPTEWVKLGLSGRAEHKPFYAATGGRARLSSKINPPN